MPSRFVRRGGPLAISNFFLLLLLLGCSGQPPKELFELAVKYQNGDGVPKDTSKAAEYYTQAAKRGYAPAEFNLAVMYQSGDGIAKDPAQAVHWYAEAA